MIIRDYYVISDIKIKIVEWKKSKKKDVSIFELLMKFNNNHIKTLLDYLGYF